MCISISSTDSNKMTAYSFLVLIVLCATNARARADSNALSNEITEIIKNTMKCRNNPALAVSVVKDGSVVYSRGFGSRDLDHQANVTRSTVFGVASLSKAFAATLILKLLEENSKYDFFLYQKILKYDINLLTCLLIKQKPKISFDFQNIIFINYLLNCSKKN